jgi:predicted 3-demethylubiquinone-9 3-methyltransferase (glyoxalase superfamily)
MSKMTMCLWFDHGKAREAAEFYASVFPDSRVGESHASAADNPSAKAGEELTVEFTVLGQAFIGLNGGPSFKPNEAVSFMILTENQEDTDRYCLLSAHPARDISEFPSVPWSGSGVVDPLHVQQPEDPTLQPAQLRREHHRRTPAR